MMNILTPILIVPPGTPLHPIYKNPTFIINSDYWKIEFSTLSQTNVYYLYYREPKLSTIPWLIRQEELLNIWHSELLAMSILGAVLLPKYTGCYGFAVHKSKVLPL